MEFQTCAEAAAPALHPRTSGYGEKSAPRGGSRPLKVTTGHPLHTDFITAFGPQVAVDKARSTSGPPRQRCPHVMSHCAPVLDFAAKDGSPFVGTIAALGK